MSRSILRTGAMVVAFLALSGCTTAGSVLPEEGIDIGQILTTASGALRTIQDQAVATVELGKQGVAGAKEKAADLQRRADRIKEGMQKVNEGRKLIQEGLAQ